MANLNTDINDRLTPSVPLETTFDAQDISAGAKVTTIFAHMAPGGGTALPYAVYPVNNIGDAASAKAELDAQAGVNSQASLMAQAFVNAVQAGGVNGQSNFTNFRVALIPYGVSGFGPNQEAITAVKSLRSDMIVSCYQASDVTNRGILLALVALISGIDRDLMGQFGSFLTVGSLDSKTVQEQYAVNSPFCLVASLPDSNTALVEITGTVTSGSPIITAPSQAPIDIDGILTAGSTIVTGVASTAGILPGASITGTGIPANTTVEQVTSNSITMSAEASSTEASEAIVVTNLPTAGIYPGAAVSGTGIPALTTVLSVAASTITMSKNATATGAAENIAIQNQVSQAAEIVAAGHAGAMMASPQPYNPLQGVTIGGLIPPQIASDRVQIDPTGDSEAMLIAGLSPLYVQPGGTVGFIRTRTTWTLKTDGVTPITNYFDWQQLVVLNDFKEVIYGVSQSPPFNNNPGGTKNSATIANLFKDEVLREASDFEDEGMFENTKQLAPYFKVQPSTTSPGRLDFKVPVEAVPGLMVLAGNIQAISDLATFLQFQVAV